MWIKRLFAAGIMLFLLVQLVPYGRDHTNPPVVSEPAWDNAETRDLAVRACFDCHSNDTEWPWYTNVAPVSWLTQRDVDEGRRVLNFSDWTRATEESEDAAEVTAEGEMPPWYYLPTHPDARLSDGELDALVRGLEATLGRLEG